MATPELKSSHDWASTASAHVVIACGVSPPPSTPSTALHQSRSRALHVATSPHSVDHGKCPQISALGCAKNGGVPVVSAYCAIQRCHAPPRDPIAAVSRAGALGTTTALVAFSFYPLRGS